jgi:hypothetical protein
MRYAQGSRLIVWIPSEFCGIYMISVREPQVKARLIEALISGNDRPVGMLIGALSDGLGPGSE